MDREPARHRKSTAGGARMSFGGMRRGQHVAATHFTVLATLLLLARLSCSAGTQDAAGVSVDEPPALVQDLPLPGCRVCSWSSTCQSLCETAKELCTSTWEEAPDGLGCLISFADFNLTTAAAAAAAPEGNSDTAGHPAGRHAFWAHGVPAGTGRAVLSTVTYRVHKDVLSDLVHRYQQVLRVHEQGGGASAASAASAPFSLSPEHHWVVRVSFGLCFPRVALAWLWLTGQAIPPRNACCHQECHWEEMLRARAKPPTLQSLLARAAATRPTPPSLFAPPPSAPQQAGASSAPWAQPHQQPGCAAGRAGAAAGGGALARWREQVRQPGWRPAPWAWALARNVTWGDAARAACALVAPSMLVAHDALEDGAAGSQPALALLFVVLAAVLRAAVELHTFWSIANDRMLDFSDRVVSLASSCLLSSIAMVVLAVLAATWLPMLHPAGLALLLRVQFVALPLLGSLLLHLARYLHQVHQRDELDHLLASDFESLNRQLQALHAIVQASNLMTGNRRPRRDAARQTSAAAAASPRRPGPASNVVVDELLLDPRHAAADAHATSSMASISAAGLRRRESGAVAAAAAAAGDTDAAPSFGGAGRTRVLDAGGLAAAPGGGGSAAAAAVAAAVAAAAGVAEDAENLALIESLERFLYPNASPRGVAGAGRRAAAAAASGQQQQQQQRGEGLAAQLDWNRDPAAVAAVAAAVMRGGLGITPSITTVTPRGAAGSAASTAGTAAADSAGSPRGGGGAGPAAGGDAAGRRAGGAATASSSAAASLPWTLSAQLAAARQQRSLAGESDEGGDSQPSPPVSGVAEGPLGPGVLRGAYRAAGLINPLATIAAAAAGAMQQQQQQQQQGGQGGGGGGGGVSAASVWTHHQQQQLLLQQQEQAQAQRRARQAAVAAAMAAIHWPPPLELPAWVDDAPNVPHAFRCPITLSVMREPTQASSGVTYERSAIFHWLSVRREDPVTHVALKRHRLTPNLNLRHMIEDWVEANKAAHAPPPPPPAGASANPDASLGKDSAASAAAHAVDGKA